MEKKRKLKIILLCSAFLFSLTDSYGQEVYESYPSDTYESMDGSSGVSTLPSGDSWDQIHSGGGALYGEVSPEIFGSGEEDPGPGGGDPIGGEAPLGELPVFSLLLVAFCYTLCKRKNLMKKEQTVNWLLKR